MSDWLHAWWAERVAPPDEGDVLVPAWYWRAADGSVSPGPVSFTATALTKSPRVINLPALRQQLHRLLIPDWRNQ